MGRYSSAHREIMGRRNILCPCRGIFFPLGSRFVRPGPFWSPRQLGFRGVDDVGGKDSWLVQDLCFFRFGQCLVPRPKNKEFRCQYLFPAGKIALARPRTKLLYPSFPKPPFQEVKERCWCRGVPTALSVPSAAQSPSRVSPTTKESPFFLAFRTRFPLARPSRGAH